MSSDQGYRYRITVRGECGTLLAHAIDGIEVETCRVGRTCVVVSVCDESELWGLMERIQDLALRIISLYEIGEDAPPPPSESAAAQ